MGLQTDVGMTSIKANVLQRMLQRAGGTKLGTALFSRLLGPLDRVAHKLTGGRLSVGRVFGALPVVFLGTVGARSGKQRLNPVNAIPLGGDLGLVGSNYGAGSAPGWAHNLRANSAATIAYSGVVADVVASEVDGVTYEEVFAAAVRVYPGYARYRREASNRIPVFVLRSRSET